MNQSLSSLKAYLGQTQDQPPWAPAPGVVVVGSGKGGVGTSTVSALLALAAAAEGRKVLLLDGDESAGSLHLLLGLTDAGPGIGSLRGGDLTPRDLLRRLGKNLWFLPGGGGGADATLALALGERRALFRRVAGLYDEFDLVVLDGGSHLTSVMAACGAGAERLLALTTPDRVAMAATYALLKVGTERFPCLPMEIVVNGTDPASAEEVFRMMFLAGSRFLRLEVPYGGSIPRDPELEQLHAEGRSLRSVDFGTAAPRAAERLHARLASEQEAAGSLGADLLPLSAVR